MHAYEWESFFVEKVEILPQEDHGELLQAHLLFLWREGRLKGAMST